MIARRLWVASCDIWIIIIPKVFYQVVKVILPFRQEPGNSDICFQRLGTPLSCVYDPFSGLLLLKFLQLVCHISKQAMKVKLIGSTQCSQYIKYTGFVVYSMAKLALRAQIHSQKPTREINDTSNWICQTTFQLSPQKLDLFKWHRLSVNGHLDSFLSLHPAL